jgi:small subunit ribosomal protein S20
MPITKGAKKAVRNADKKRVFNVRRTRKAQAATKDVEKLVVAGDFAGAEKQLAAAYKAIDKAAKMNTITKNTASRRKSRLAASIKRAKATK